VIKYLLTSHLGNVVEKYYEELYNNERLAHDGEMVESLTPFEVLYFGLSDPGLRRSHNEDRCKVLPEANFFVVADGMGGHQGGEIAAEESVNQLCELFGELIESGRLDGKTSEEVGGILGQVFELVNEEVFDRACTEQQLEGMGTTLCCAFLHDSNIVYGNVGDSRIYRQREGCLKQLTRDDSLVRDLLDLGQLEEADIEDFIYKNVITKSIGMGPTLAPSVDVASVIPGDIYMLCTDGLSNMLSREEMEAIIATLESDEAVTIEESTRALVGAAKERGGDDNVTVILVQVQ